MENILIELKDVSLSYHNRKLLQDINLKIHVNNPVFINGTSGSGKTILGKIIAQQLLPSLGDVIINQAAKPIVFISQQQAFRTSFSQRSYYQNRYEVNNDRDIPFVKDYLLKYFPDNFLEAEMRLRSFSLHYILDRKLNQLSNGEGKRLQIIAALLQNPSVLILDNPLIGIDKQNRELLIHLLDDLAAKNISYILLSSVSHIPQSCKTIIHLENGKIISVEAAKDYSSTKTKINLKGIEEKINILFDAIPYTPVQDFDIAIRMRNVTIQYDEAIVLKNINWQVNRGERWLIRGANGSGKSMLLSLINGDNPKAFGKDILLFDKQKGSGESIWELKNRIGYVSPEMHTHYLRNPEHIADVVSRSANLEDVYQPKMTCSQVIASGFNDEVGFTSSITELQKKIVEAWIIFLDIKEFAHQSYYQLPLGVQRLLLLARAMVRNPSLLILDEPCQGLDEEQTNLFKETVEHLSNKFGNTILYVSHYDADVPANITHRLELEKGEVVDGS